MTETRRRTIYYYKIEAKHKTQDVNTYDLFSNLLAHDIEDKQHHYSMQSSGRTIIIKVDSNENLLIRGFIANIRQNNLPGIIDLTTESLTGLDLKDGTALIDPAHFVIYKDHIAIEFNANAPRVSVIWPYMQRYFSEECDFLSFLPIMEKGSQRSS